MSTTVGADCEWTDESRPLVMFTGSMSAREAALTIVGEAVWSSMLDGSCDDLSALEWAGLVAVLDDVPSLHRHSRYQDRFSSGVLAWFTSRMTRSVMCVADGHDEGGLRWFGRCDVDVDDDECPACLSRDRDERLDLADDATCADGWHDEPSASPHVLTDVWFVDGEADEFIPFVIALSERWRR